MMFKISNKINLAEQSLKVKFLSKRRETEILEFIPNFDQT